MIRKSIPKATKARIANRSIPTLMIGHPSLMSNRKIARPPVTSAMVSHAVKVHAKSLDKYMRAPPAVELLNLIPIFCFLSAIYTRHRNIEHKDEK